MITGTVCHEHFELATHGFNGSNEGCLDCEVAKQVARDRLQQQAIDPAQPYGQHIGLVCRACGQGYSTKNISPIGARSIFASSVGCDHPLSDLEVAT